MFFSSTIFYSILQRAVRSTPYWRRSKLRPVDIASRVSGYFTEPNWKSRFCYHLYYQRSRTHRTQNSQALLHISGSPSRLSSASLFRRRSVSTIPTSQTSNLFQFFRIKGCLSSGIAFKASCALRRVVRRSKQ